MKKKSVVCLPSLQCRGHLAFQYGILLVLGHRLELVVWIYIRLDYHDGQFFSFINGVSVCFPDTDRCNEREDKDCCVSCE